MSENLNQPATKADLLALRTELKTEIGSLRTELKADIGRLDKTTKGIALDMVYVKEKIQNIEENMLTKEDGRRMLTLLERSVTQSDDYRKQDLLRGNAVMQHEEQIADHEKRLTDLEKP